jgi:hypothetical protein
MARWNFFNKGDHYSEWHRKITKPIAMIDIDSVPICHRKGCWKPLAIVETVFDTGKYNKYTNVVENMARGLNIRGYLVYYKPIGDTGSLEFKVKRLVPDKSELTPMSEQEWSDNLEALQLEHDWDAGHVWKPNENGKFVGWGKNQDNLDSKGNLIKK